MSGISIQRSGFTRVPEMFAAIVKDLVANGFTQQFPSTPIMDPVAGTPYAPFKVTLEASADIDPLHDTQAWRIQFSATATQAGSVFVTAPLQLPDDGTVGLLEAVSLGLPQLPAGMVNGRGKLPDPDPTADQSDAYFVYRSHRIKDAATAEAYPFSYRLSITSRGIALIVWEDASDNLGSRHSWLAVQRPVDRLTGQPLIVGHCPLVCVFGLKGKPYKFIVRENDVLKPTIPVVADSDTEDSKAIMNSTNQVAITENNRYVIAFPNGLNTPRYMYTEELDMIAYTSADVVSAYTDVDITVYGEAAPRTYAAMQANGPFNTGMRLLMLKGGGGID